MRLRALLLIALSLLLGAAALVLTALLVHLYAAERVIKRLSRERDRSVLAETAYRQGLGDRFTEGSWSASLSRVSSDAFILAAYAQGWDNADRLLASFPSVPPEACELQQHVLLALLGERDRQCRKWKRAIGEWDSPMAEKLVVLQEEGGECSRAYLDGDPEQLKTELIHVGAVAVAILESIASGETPASGPP